MCENTNTDGADIDDDDNNNKKKKILYYLLNYRLCISKFSNLKNKMCNMIS